MELDYSRLAHELRHLVRVELKQDIADALADGLDARRPPGDVMGMMIAAGKAVERQSAEIAQHGAAITLLEKRMSAVAVGTADIATNLAALSPTALIGVSERIDSTLKQEQDRTRGLVAVLAGHIDRLAAAVEVLTDEVRTLSAEQARAA